ncbi:MAG TPA: cation:proton antiporter [archaeon]|nr:cation:proton antiporter [archaeon]
MAVEGLALLFDLGLILLAATLFNYIARALNQPALLAYIAAGIFIGPLGLGALGIDFAGVQLGVTTTEEIILFSELGVAFLLFSIGVESNFSKMRELGKIAIIGSVIQVALTALLVFVFNHFLGLLSFEQALYLGLIVAFSSTTIVVKLLADEYEINTIHGRLMIGFLLIQDVLVILALPLLDNISNALSIDLVLPLIFKVIALLVIAFLLNRYVYPKAFHFASNSDELFFLTTMSSVFIFIFISFILDFSIAVGAFVAGVALSTLPYNLDAIHKVRGVRDFLATIFFVTLGIQITPSFVSFPIALAIVLIGIVFIFKPLIYYAITLLNGYGGRVSLMVALGLAQASEFSFIIANQGRAILDQTPGLYSFVIVLIAGSMAITPYFMNSTSYVYNLIHKILGKAIIPFKKSKFLHSKIWALEGIPSGLKDHIVIVGGGVVGSRIASTLKDKFNLVVYDNDSQVVADNMRHGINSTYGSVNNEEIWRKLELENAKALILAVPNAKATIPFLKFAKRTNPKLAIFARARYYTDALALYKIGADLVIMPQVLAGDKFIEKVTQYFKTGKIEKPVLPEKDYLQDLEDHARRERTRFVENKGH